MSSVAVVDDPVETTIGSEVADRYDFVVGIDTHARHHVVAIVSATGRLVKTQKFPTTPAELGQVSSWIAEHAGVGTDRVLVSMESTGCYGAVLADLLDAAGYRVTEAPIPRRGMDGKADHLDARLAARAVLGLPVARLRDRRAGELGQALQILTTSRDSLTTERTATVNQLTALLRSHDLGEDARASLKISQIRQIAAWRVRKEPLVVRIARAEAVRLARRIGELDTELKTNHRQLSELITADAPELLALPGLGPVSAAIVLSAWSQPGRIRTEAGFAKLAGTCPIQASSGNTVRHRLNPFGDRRLNRATHMIVINRLRIDPATREYRDRRVAEGKTPKEARRCLKRYVTRQLFRTLAKTKLDTI